MVERVFETEVVTSTGTRGVTVFSNVGGEGRDVAAGTEGFRARAADDEDRCELGRLVFLDISCVISVGFYRIRRKWRWLLLIEG